MGESGLRARRQFKRMRRVLRRQRTLLGRVIRDIGRQLDTLDATSREQMQVLLERADRIFRQTSCMSCTRRRWSALARKPYEVRDEGRPRSDGPEGAVVGARSFAGNPYDGDTLEEQLEQVEIVSGQKSKM